MAKSSLYKSYFLLLLVISGLIHCTKHPSNAAKHNNAWVNLPTADSSKLLLTFSTPEYNAPNVSLFVLGLVDVIATLKLPNQQMIEFSLYGLDYITLNDNLPTTILNLSDPHDQHYHFIDNFQMPSGELTALTFIFSSLQTQIAQQGNPVVLLDSFSTPLTNTVNAENNDNTTQDSTIQTTLNLSSTIELTKDDSFALNIVIDKALTAAISFTDPEKQPTAPLIPVMTAQDMTSKAASGIPLHIERKSTIHTYEKSLRIGHTPPFHPSYTQEKDSNIQLNNQRIKDISQINDGQFFIHLQGNYQLTSQHFSINNAQFFTLNDNTKESIQKGRWLTDKAGEPYFIGYAIPLDFVTDFTPINAKKMAVTWHPDNAYMTLFWDGTQHVLINDRHYEPAIENDILLLQQHIQLTHPDLLSIQNAQESEQNVSFKLPEPQSCHAIILSSSGDCQNVSSHIDNIHLPLSKQGEFTLILSRNGDITPSSDTWVLDASADVHKTFNNSTDFYRALKEAILDKAYRVNSLSAEGNLHDNTFIVHDKANIILLAAQKPLDDFIDNHREQQNPNTLSPTTIALISTAAISVASFAALAIIYGKIHHGKNKKGGQITTWDRLQPASGQLTRVTPKPVTLDNTGGTTAQGITFSDGQQDISLKKVILTDRTLDLSIPENHPIFERGTGTYYFPKTQYQIDNGLPADTLFYPSYTNESDSNDVDIIKQNMLLTMQLGENIQSVLSNDNIAIETNILALLKTAEDTFKIKENDYQRQIEAAKNKLSNHEIDIKTYGRLTRPPSGRKNLIKK